MPLKRILPTEEAQISSTKETETNGVRKNVYPQKLLLEAQGILAECYSDEVARRLGPNAQRSTNLESSNFNTLLTKALLKLIEL